MFARDLQRGFVRLGPAVGQKRLLHPAQPAEDLCQLRLLLDVVEIADVHQLRGLLLYGLHDARMAMTDAVDGDARKEVQIAAALGVPQVGAFAAVKDHVEARVGRHHIFRVCGGRAFQPCSLSCRCGHLHLSPWSVSLLRTKVRT